MVSQHEKLAGKLKQIYSRIFLLPKCDLFCCNWMINCIKHPCDNNSYHVCQNKTAFSECGFDELSIWLLISCSVISVWLQNYLFRCEDDKSSRILELCVGNSLTLYILIKNLNWKDIFVSPISGNIFVMLQKLTVYINISTE
jgi:hypothetical protein